MFEPRRKRGSRIKRQLICDLNAMNRSSTELIKSDVMTISTGQMWSMKTEQSSFNVLTRKKEYVV